MHLQQQRFLLSHRLVGGKEGFAAGLPVHFVVEVSHDLVSGMWSAVCDDLGLVTEAGACDALLARVCEIAPELLAENFAIPPQSMAGPQSFSLDRFECA
ncbi:DUF1902 domain-containing protein [Verminephrobacter aporrectodeae subsp. tuberculatae]|uniref:DUF1902 domain-containing protein n=2 Tax=Verminephrobacter TaxID=364316 RepID=A0ABT3KSZ4_9BURK|nr:DUF1902 domain-containing protein [Verminephrobacter aporrectodeae subsp. tuberculatae]MCW5257372.1 DUF1902 domain-containing protein [Verminephrobacter aporrectodeae subsp. tuberculatae]MCW5287887.1 DUF1902 domain-containing protein [Verminephrobacter aporrectodeae subsp. tuberculatae]MCW5321443.1 DUF1902 domain-containing protein [Verminephrobacter aporrectodeae subsp. tuberculatae]MCW8166786.1 DUF1902 domain-containing protein [Verminephrobacter aporrectodeae subsp. tuberculatae]